jgi:uncharacterized protein YjiS (DUF1127 family)
MANTNVYAVRTAGFSLSARAQSVFAALKAGFARQSAYRRTFNELSQLTDRELADIGLARGMIHDIAKSEAERF